jgi:hypothetical protein
MTRTQLEPDELARMLLTGDVQEELGIVGETVRHFGSYFSFRMDPGNLFERRGYLYDKHDGIWDIGIIQRYLPDEQSQLISRANARPLAGLPAALRQAVSVARGSTAYCPHWLERVRVATSPWWLTCPTTKPDASSIVTSAAAQRARETGTVYFVYAGTGLVTAVNSAPGSERFYSVTSDGDWSLHSGALTRPLITSPVLQTEPPPAARRRPVAARQTAGRRR